MLMYWYAKLLMTECWSKIICQGLFHSISWFLPKCGRKWNVVGLTFYCCRTHFIYLWYTGEFRGTYLIGADLAIPCRFRDLLYKVPLISVVVCRFCRMFTQDPWFSVQFFVYMLPSEGSGTYWARHCEGKTINKLAPASQRAYSVGIRKNATGERNRKWVMG